MKKASTFFLKISILLITIGTIAGLIRFPQTEGRAAGLDLINIYKDPVIIYMYIASIPFFAALFQAFKLLGHIDQNKIFSQFSINTVGKIKYCGLAVIAFIVGAEIYLFLVMRGTSDDIAGGVMTGLFLLFVSSVITASAVVFQNILQSYRLDGV